MKNFIIPIFIPHWGCRHQCVFCSQNTITGRQSPLGSADIDAEIQAGLARVTEPRRIEVAFYGGSFTALPLSLQAELLNPAYQALKAGIIHGIRLSTRPDCISTEVIEQLHTFGVDTVELGVQSLDDRVLRRSERGHSAADSILALKRLNDAGFHTVAQLMVGLPGESWDSLITTSFILKEAKPHAIRIYPTVVLAGTPLARMYQQGQYQTLSLDEAVAKAAFLKCQAEYQDIAVIRVGLQATNELQTDGAILSGPYHPSFGEMVSSWIFFLMVARLLETVGKNPLSATVYHHAKDHSKVRGIANSNLRRWKERFQVAFVCKPDNSLMPGELSVQLDEIRFLINSSILSTL